MAPENESEEEVKSGGDTGGDEEGGEEGLPPWMGTFADLVTLLMCFFVLLFATSSTQQETFKELIRSLRSALGVQQIPEAGNREGLEVPPMAQSDAQGKKDDEAVDQMGVMAQKEVEEIISETRELIMFNKLAGFVNAAESEMGVTITISDMILFHPGEVKMNREGLKVMKKIADLVSQFPYHIKVAGHTDNTPISSACYVSNWELSANRACDVVRFLIEQGIDPRRLSASGYAFYKPVDTNDNPEGRARNRRVEIIYERQSIITGLNEQAREGETEKGADSESKPDS